MRCEWRRNWLSCNFNVNSGLQIVWQLVAVHMAGKFTVITTSNLLVLDKPNLDIAIGTIKSDETKNEPQQQEMYENVRNRIHSHKIKAVEMWNWWTPWTSRMASHFVRTQMLMMIGQEVFVQKSRWAWPKVLEKWKVVVLLLVKAAAWAWCQSVNMCGFQCIETA